MPDKVLGVLEGVAGRILGRQGAPLGRTTVLEKTRFGKTCWRKKKALKWFAFDLLCCAFALLGFGSRHAGSSHVGSSHVGSSHVGSRHVLCCEKEKD